MRYIPRSAGRQAEEFLRRALAQGPVPVAEMVETAAREKITRATLYRQARRLQVEGIPTGQGRYKWALPQQSVGEAPNGSAPVVGEQQNRQQPRQPPLAAALVKVDRLTRALANVNNLVRGGLSAKKAMGNLAFAGNWDEEFR